MKVTGPVETKHTSFLFQKSFNTMEDPRRTDKGNFYYPLQEIFFLSISAMLCGFNSWLAISTFGEEKLEWLRKFFPFENGTPSHDALGKVFSKLDPVMFSECFTNWVSSLIELMDGEIVAFDGKTIRGSGAAGKGKKALHIVSAFAAGNRICLGQTGVDAKENEIVAIPELLDLIEIKGCTVTIDAMGCQKKIAKKIRQKEAHYLLMVKDNQQELKSQVQKMFEFKRPNDTHEDLDAGHGRVENRKCESISDLKFFDTKEDWFDLNTVVRIKSERYDKKTGKTGMDTRYYISSLPSDAKSILNAARSHWAVENTLHWNLDVVMKEDSALKKNGNSAQNTNIMAKIALYMLEKEKSVKKTKPQKMNKAALNDRYREKLLML